MPVRALKVVPHLCGGIETLFDKLKSSMGLEHTRHRSPSNALIHILSCLAATPWHNP